MDGGIEGTTTAWQPPATPTFWTAATELLQALQEPCTWPDCETGGNFILDTFPKSLSLPEQTAQNRPSAAKMIHMQLQGASPEGKNYPLRCRGRWPVLRTSFPLGTSTVQ